LIFFVSNYKGPILSVNRHKVLQRLGAKVIGLVQQDVGASQAIVERIMVMMKVNPQFVTNRIELVVRKFWEELTTGLHGVERQVACRWQIVVFQGTSEHAIVEGCVVRDDQAIALKEGRDVFPDLREGGGVGDIAFVNTVNLNVAPEEVGVWLDQ